MLSFIDFRKMIIGVMICGSLGLGSAFGQNLWPDEDDTSSAHISLGYAKFAKWSCTDYAASRRKDLFPSRWGSDRRFWGNAISWLSQAQRTGVPTGKQPQVWAVAVFRWWRWASSSYGHVAIVEKIVDDSTIVVSDMNYTGRNKVTTRRISDTVAIGYIYTMPQSKTIDDHQTKTNIIIVELSTKPPQDNSDIQAGSIAKDKISWSLLSSDTMIYSTEHESNIPNDVPLALWDTQINLMMDNRNIIKNLSEQHRVRTYTGMIIKEYSNNNLFSHNNTS